MSSSVATVPRPTVLVDVTWAVDHLDDPGVRFIEVDERSGRGRYGHGHIPGAVNWDWATQLCDPVERDVAGRQQLSGLLSDSGIKPDTHVVLYGDHENWFAAWAFWLLRRHGFERLSLLDGGRRYWIERQLPVSTVIPSYGASGIELAEPGDGLRAFRDELLGRLGDPGLIFVDVRTPAEYTGEVIAPLGMTETAQRGGHIPGAVSIPWEEAIAEDGTFRSVPDLRAIYEARGVMPDRDVVTYCRIGERSSHSWFVLHELLGYPSVRNYDGSWTEWGSIIRAPIERAEVAAALS